MIEYSKRSRRAVARLMAAYNDIDIYVEDSTYVGLYERLVNKALGGRAKVQKVIALGAKQDVLQAANNDNNPEGRPRLYIVDGDLDLIAHLRNRRAMHLHRLRVYSLENLLFEERCIEAYCAFSCPALTREEALSRVDIPLIMSQFNAKLNNLVIALAVARRLDLRDNAFRLDFRDLFEVSRGKYAKISDELLSSRLVAVIRRIKELKSLKDYRSAKADVIAGIRKKGLRGIDYVPGKSMLWYLNERVGLASGQSHNPKAVASYLADHCTLSMDTTLVRRLRKLAKPT